MCLFLFVFALFYLVFVLSCLCFALIIIIHVIIIIITRTKSFWKKQFGFRDETGIKSTETRWATVGFMRHTCTLNISYLNMYCIKCSCVTHKPYSRPSCFCTFYTCFIPKSKLFFPETFCPSFISFSTRM